MSSHLIKKIINNSKKKKELFSSLHLSTTTSINPISSPKVKNIYSVKQRSKPKKSCSLSPVKTPSNTHFTKSKIKEKTLVIDLDETLVHSSFEYFNTPDVIVQVDLDGDGKQCEVYVSIRPGAKEFISELSNFYEIIIFTASSSKYAEPLMNMLDENQIISHKFFRDNCTVKEGLYIKDLSQIGRELKNIVLIDNNVVSFTFQQENGIPIKSWFDDYNDIELFKLIPILKNLSGFYDVRTEIPKFVSSNTFIWMKGINWLKENLLNITFYNEVENVLKLEKRNFAILKQSISVDNGEISHNHLNNKKENDTPNDFIKITNNFFYDNSSNIKIIEDDTDCENDEFKYERMLTEIDQSKKDQKFEDGSGLRKSSSLKRKKFISTSKFDKPIKKNKNEFEKKNLNNLSTIENIFKKFPKLNKKIDFSTKEKNKSLNENVFLGKNNYYPPLSFLTKQIEKKHHDKSANNSKPIHHIPSYSINYLGLQKKVRKATKAIVK